MIVYLRYLRYLRSDAYGSVCCIIIPYQGLLCLGSILFKALEEFRILFTSHFPWFKFRDNCYLALSRLGFETGTFECLGSISRQWRSSFILYAQSHLSNTIISVNKDNICCCYCAVYYCIVIGTIHSNAYGSVFCIITCLMP